MSNDNKKTPECQSDVSPTFSVYVLWCKITGKYYVGVTRRTVEIRVREHKDNNRQFVDHEIQRTGWEESKWDWYVVETGVPANLISKREQDWVAFFNCVYPNGYNKTCGGISNIIVSEDTREKMRKYDRKGRKYDHKGEKNPHYGHKHTEESKEKNRQSNLGRRHTEEEKAKMRGRRHTEEEKAKISKANRGKRRSEKTRAKMREKALIREAKKRAEREAAALAAAENAENQDKTS